jgi:transcriptional regulator CtsR
VAVACLSDEIESHLLGMLDGADEIEVQRAELASRFQCAPSQITYVLVTRFTPARGFVVQSRRGGGGYIRVVRLPTGAAEAVAAVPDAIDQAGAEHHLDRLEAAGLLTEREAAILRAVVSRDVLAVPLPMRDRLRASILRAALQAVLARGRAAVERARGRWGPTRGTAGAEA